MTLFTSRREKRYWSYASLVLLAILLSLFIGQPLAQLIKNQFVQGALFIIGLLLTGIAILIHTLNKKTSRIEVIVIIGIVAVYALLLVRLANPERTHLIEYSILTIFIHKALIERQKQSKQILKPTVLALIITILIGVLDEGIQYYLPNRVFDLRDILFNAIAVIAAIFTHVALSWIRKLTNK